MDRLSVPGPSHLGSHWIEVTAITAQYPTDGRGGAGLLNASELVGKTRVLIDGWTLQQHVSPNGFTLVDGDGNGIFVGVEQHVTRKGVFERLGDPLEVSGPFGAKLASASAPVIVWYSIVK